MTQYLITCRSLTYAQKSVRLLERAGITAVVSKVPQGLSTGGCGYGVGLSRHFNEAVALLKKENMISGKLFVKYDGGAYAEIK